MDYGDFDPSEYLPEGFLPDDLSEDQSELFGDIRDVLGRPVGQLVASYEDLAESGRAGQVRATKFSSGLEALLWLFRRGIFLYSNLIQYPDGSWGVAIGDSPGAGQSEKNIVEPSF